MEPTRYALSSAGNPQAFAAAGPGRYRKDVIRTGNFYVPAADVWLDVSEERIDRWVAAFEQMASAGVPVNLTRDHLPGASGVIGKIVRLWREGPQLLSEVIPADAEAETLLQRCPYVSLELERPFKDGLGNAYPEAIPAVTVTRDPVVPGQGEFVRIAASRDGKSESQVRILMAIDQRRSEGSPSPSLKFGRSDSMTKLTLNEALTAAVLAALAIPAETPEAELGQKVADAVTGLKTKIDGAAKVSDDLKLSRTKIDELTAALATANKGKAPEVDSDALDAAAESKALKLSRLAERGRITPAVKAKLEAVLCGTTTTRPSICLSRKAAAHAGLTSPLADQIIDALEDNDPAKLAELMKQNTGPQRMDLSRNVPGTDNTEADAVKADEKAAAEWAKRQK